MAMLSESRRKQKISTDPRGNAWRKDENKFGQKLMEKMGWSEGKGLGAKEDGNVDHVAISLKPDKRGVGCSKSHVDNWIAHQDDFSALLEQLNENHRSETPDTPVGGSVLKMEEKSRKAKGRVHYQKFAKGKDLSLKSETDLDCVFGKRKSRSGTNTPDVQASSDESDETSKASHGVKTIRSTDSIQEYFARKMAERKSKLGGNLENDDKVNNSEEINSTPDSVDSGETKKKKKKKKKDKKRVKEMEDENKQESGVTSDYPENKVSFAIGGEDSENELESEKERHLKKPNEPETVEDNEICAEKTSESQRVSDGKRSKKSKKNKRRHNEAFGENINSVHDRDSRISENDKQDVDENAVSEGAIKKVKKSKKQRKRERENE